MSLQVREILSLVTLICILWDTILTFVLLYQIISIKKRLVRVEGKNEPNRSD